MTCINVLTCIDTCLTLDGSTSSPFNLLTFEWSGGNIKSGEDTPNPIVNFEGNYQLIVTNTQNFCKDTAEVLIGIDTISPMAIITLLDGDTLTCMNNELTLDGSNSTGQNIDYQWIGNVSPSNNIPFVTTSKGKCFFNSNSSN